MCHHNPQNSRPTLPASSRPDQNPLHIATVLARSCLALRASHFRRRFTLISLRFLAICSTLLHVTPALHSHLQHHNSFARQSYQQSKFLSLTSFATFHLVSLTAHLLTRCCHILDQIDIIRTILHIFNTSLLYISSPLLSHLPSHLINSKRYQHARRYQNRCLKSDSEPRASQSSFATTTSQDAQRTVVHELERCPGCEVPTYPFRNPLYRPRQQSHRRRLR